MGDSVVTPGWAAPYPDWGRWASPFVGLLRGQLAAALEARTPLCLKLFREVRLPADVPPRRPPSETDSTVPATPKPKPDPGQRHGEDQEAEHVTDEGPERANRAARIPAA